MNNTFKNILIGLGILVLVIGTGLGVNAWKENRIQKETTLRVESEMRFKQKEIEAKKLVIERDSIQTVIDKKQTLIDYLQNNPQVIIQKTDATHISIDKLNAINTALLWTNNITEYDNSRERYSLLRFGKKP